MKTGDTESRRRKHFHPVVKIGVEPATCILLMYSTVGLLPGGNRKEMHGALKKKTAMYSERFTDEILHV